MWEKTADCGDHSMKVQQLIRSQKLHHHYISPDAWVITTLRKLQKHNVGAIVVSADGQQVEGVISERDIGHGISRYGARALKFLVSDLMSENVIKCHASDTVLSVTRKMDEFGVRHVPVVNAKGHYIAMISMRDIVRQQLKEIEYDSNGDDALASEQVA